MIPPPPPPPPPKRKDICLPKRKNDIKELFEANNEMSFAFITEFTLKDCSVRKAESYNSRGKVEFQEKRYEDACQQYSYALECLPRDQEDDNRVKYLCNRAACHVRLV